MITKYIITASITIMTLMSIFVYGRQYYVKQQLAQNVLRFHVLANSDTIEDQNLKLSVRDAVGCFMQEKLKYVEDKKASEVCIASHLVEIEEIAKNVITEEGFDYEVKAEVTNCYFPMKTYGEYTFPSGNYDALRITIGAGEGQNWWCVMYPNMCFANSMYEVVDKNSKAELQKVLDEETYQAVLKSGDYELRFWFVDFLENVERKYDKRCISKD